MRLRGAVTATLVVVLVAFGVIGFQQIPITDAANVTGISGCNGTIVAPGGTCDFTITFFDDTTPASGVQATASGGTLTSVSTTCAPTMTITGNGTGSIFAATDGASATNCDNQTPDVSNQYAWTLRWTCPGTTTTATTFTITLTVPTAAGAGANIGSLSPALPVLPGTTTPGITIQCVSTLPVGNSTITIRKVDQFGQPLRASFSIQQGPFWVEVARVNLDSGLHQNPCATDGTQGSLNITNAGSDCFQAGVITPAIFASGLPAGQYRVVEVDQSNSWCRLVQVYNGNQAQNITGSWSFSGTLLTQPVTLNLPDANVLDLQLTFMNSCTVPGAPSTSTSQISVVVGGNTPGLVNTSTVEINPAPGSDDDARVDIAVRDAANIPIPNAHVTVLIDKGTLALRRDVSTFPNSGYKPQLGYGDRFGDGDTCDQSTNGWWQQSTSSGGFTWPFLTSSRQAADSYTDSGGNLSACVYVDPVLAPGTAPGKINIQAIVESPAQGGLYNGSAYYDPAFSRNLSRPNYLGVPNIVLTATITVVGPPASITVAAAPTSLNCGEKATITVTVKDSAGQNVSDRTRVELVTNFGGVIGGTAATLGPVGITGGNVYPVSSSSAETFNGVGTAFLLTSTDHVGPYEVVAAAGGSAMASNGFLAPWYTPGATSSENDLTPSTTAYFPWYSQGLLSYSPSSAPVNAQATVTCTVPGAPAAAAPAPVVTAPRTGQGPADAFAIRPPNTGDAGLATSSSGSPSAVLRWRQLPAAT